MLSLYQQGSGERILEGHFGLIYHAKGEVWFDRAPKVGIDSHLLSDLKQIVDELGIRVWSSSIDTGKHAVRSRHYRGLADDIWRIATVGQEPELVTTTNHWARLVARTLGQHGFRHYENGRWACVLLGPPMSEFNKTKVNHSDHLHISLWGRG